MLKSQPEQFGQRFVYQFIYHSVTQRIDSGCRARFFLQAKDVSICGVEITEGAARVDKHPFNRSTAFVLGNEVT